MPWVMPAIGAASSLAGGVMGMFGGGGGGDSKSYTGQPDWLAQKGNVWRQAGAIPNSILSMLWNPAQWAGKDQSRQATLQNLQGMGFGGGLRGGPMALSQAEQDVGGQIGQYMQGNLGNLLQQYTNLAGQAAPGMAAVPDWLRWQMGGRGGDRMYYPGQEYGRAESTIQSLLNQSPQQAFNQMIQQINPKYFGGQSGRGGAMAQDIYSQRQQDLLQQQMGLFGQEAQARQQAQQLNAANQQNLWRMAQQGQGQQLQALTSLPGFLQGSYQAAATPGEAQRNQVYNWMQQMMGQAQAGQQYGSNMMNMFGIKHGTGGGQASTSLGGIGDLLKMMGGIASMYKPGTPQTPQYTPYMQQEPPVTPPG